MRSRGGLPDVRHPAAGAGIHPVDHNSLQPEGDRLHHHHPLQGRPLHLQGAHHHLQGLQQALRCHRAPAAAGQRYADNGFIIDLYSLCKGYYYSVMLMVAFKVYVRSGHIKRRRNVTVTK